MSEPYPIMVTADSVDPRFNDPYIDVDEWRDAPAPATNVFGQIVPLSDEWADPSVRHRYVHGGFKGTDAKFVFAFPPKEHYEGRFFQATHQLLTSEDPLPQNIAFALATGGYAAKGAPFTGLSRSVRSRCAGGSGTDVLLDRQQCRLAVVRASSRAMRMGGARLHDPGGDPFRRYPE